MKLKGLKKAVGEYQRVNAGGFFDPRYGKLMLDTETGDIWTDEFYSLGHQEWKVYHQKAVINLGDIIEANDIQVTMANVKNFVEYKLKEILNDNQ